MNNRNISYKLTIITALILSLAAESSKAQGGNTIFLSEGKIEFERKENLYSKLDNDNSWAELEKKTMDKFRLTYFDLTFTRNKTLYKPGKEGPVQKEGWMDRVADANVIYTDLEKEYAVSQKKVFEQLFLVSDSTRTIKWKITDENRNIAGFACRRANAIIMDTVYVVAFYTDEILTSGGPESFTGLPGMILGVALPHQHVSWFATRVQATPVAETELTVPQKGKKTDNATLKKTITETVKDWPPRWRQPFMESTIL